MRCPKCGHIMEGRREGTTRHVIRHYWKCADWLHCGHKIPWDYQRDGDYDLL